MDIKIAKFKNGAKGAFSFVFDDGCYKDSTKKVIDIFKDAYEKHGVKLIATAAHTVNFLNNDLIEFWKEAFKDGWFDLASHSMDHAFAFNEGVDIERRRKDAKESKEALERIYEGMEVISYVTCGGTNTPEGCEVLNEFYYGNRSNCEVPPYNDVDTVDLIYAHAFVPNFKYKDLAPYKEYIDTLTEKNVWGVQINHWISEKEQDTFHAQTVPSFALQCDYLAELSAKGEIWVPSFNEAVKYIKEYQNSTIEINEITDTEWEILVKNDLDKKIFTYPLTLEIKTDKDVEVTQNGEAVTYKSNNGVAYVNIVPNISATVKIK